MSSPLAPVGVDHVAINVPDVPGAITFYTETMGLEPAALLPFDPAAFVSALFAD